MAASRIAAARPPIPAPTIATRLFGLADDAARAPTFLFPSVRLEYTSQMLTAFTAPPGKGAYNNPESLEQTFSFARGERALYLQHRSQGSGQRALFVMAGGRGGRRGWLALIVLLFGGILAAGRLVTAVRWFFRQRADKVVEEVRRRGIELPTFKLTRRGTLIYRLTHDPELL